MSIKKTNPLEEGIYVKPEFPPRSTPDFKNMANCIQDVKEARLDMDSGPKDPKEFGELTGRVVACQGKLPPLYRKEVYEPYADKLSQLGETKFNQILLDDPGKEGMAGLMLDIAHSILQNGEGYNEKENDAFQEVVSDLYDGFLSEEDRHKVKKPDLSVIAPLVKWGNPDFGPYTWPAAATRYFGFGKQCAIVNLPPAHARCGLLAWAALGHETTGHDILHADKGLLPELTSATKDALEKGNVGSVLPGYWSRRIDETASDVLGILNMGPAAGIGLIGYFRGLNAASGFGPKLRNTGSLDPNVVHPVQMLRGYLAASVIKRLNFAGAGDWAKAIETETDKDLRKIQLLSNNGYIEIKPTEAKKSADIVAETLVLGKMNSLENHSLGEIQNWNDSDEFVALGMKNILTQTKPLPREWAKGYYAAHVVAAAVYAAVSGAADIPVVFGRMVGVLKTMHDKNPSWGPMYVEHPGDLVFLSVYENYEEEEG